MLNEIENLEFTAAARNTAGLTSWWIISRFIMSRFDEIRVLSGDSHECLEMYKEVRESSRKPSSIEQEMRPLPWY